MLLPQISTTAKRAMTCFVDDACTRSLLSTVLGTRTLPFSTRCEGPMQRVYHCGSLCSKSGQGKCLAFRSRHFARRLRCIEKSRRSLDASANHSSGLSLWRLRQEPRGKEMKGSVSSSAEDDGPVVTIDAEDTEVLQRSIRSSLGFECPDLDPSQLDETVARVIASVAGLGNASRILLDAGIADGPLLADILATGSKGVVIADVSQERQRAIKQRYPEVKCWPGDAVDLPPSYGPFDAIFLDIASATMNRLQKFIPSAAELLTPGGVIVICDVPGRGGELGPDSLPRKLELEPIIATLPLDLVAIRGEESPYLLILRRMSGGASTNGVTSSQGSHWFPQAPLFMRGKVVTGFGRGSKKMGVPTANLDPKDVSKHLVGVQNGVYYGWAQVISEEGIDHNVHKMVMNIGNRPTFADGDGISVEVHILSSFEKDFYGEDVKVVALGNIRPELRFKSKDELVERIQLDIDITKAKLEELSLREYKESPFFTDD